MSQTTTTIPDDLRAEIVAAVEAADLESPEQVADLAIDAAEHGRDWQAVIARAVEIDRTDAD